MWRASTALVILYSSGSQPLQAGLPGDRTPRRRRRERLTHLRCSRWA